MVTCLSSSGDSDDSDVKAHGLLKERRSLHYPMPPNLLPHPSPAEKKKADSLCPILTSASQPFPEQEGIVAAWPGLAVISGSLNDPSDSDSDWHQ